MNIKIIMTEKVAEKFIKEACNEYQKRLQRYCKFKFISVKKYEDIAKEINDRDYTLLIDNKSKLISSEELSVKISNLGVNGISNLNILYLKEGISNGVEELINDRIAISKMEFDSGLIAVMLHEQIYRAYRIMNKEPYHK